MIYNHTVIGMTGSSAPGRIGILGNPTDIYGGKVIAMAIQHRAYVWLKPCDGFSVRKPDGKEADVGLYDLINASFRRLRREGWVKEAVPKMEVTVKTEIPRESGMGGSAAVIVAFLDACRRMYGLNFNDFRLAEMVQKIEHKDLGIVSGYNDRYSIAFGGLLFMDFTGKDVDREVWDGEPYAKIRRLRTPELPLVCGYWGVKRRSGSVHAPIRKRFLMGDAKIIGAVDRLINLADRGEEALIQGDWAELGELVNEHHRVAGEAGWVYEIDDRLREIGMEHGATAAKLGGAGNGGVMVFLCPEKRETVVESLKKVGAKVFIPRVSRGVHAEI